MVLDKLQAYLPPLLSAARITVALTILGIILATVMAFLAGLANLSRSRTLRAVSRSYIELFRGTSELVQLFWVFYALPIITGYKILGFVAGVIVLGLNLGSYGAEVVRGGVLAVPKEQYEGAIALNFTRAQRMRRVILPQAIVGMIPPFNNLAIQLLKSTSLVSMIQVTDITLQANQLRSNTGDTVTLFLMILVMYFILAYILTMALRWLERRAAASVGRGPVKQTAMTAPEATT